MATRIECIGLVEGLIPDQNNDWAVIRLLGQNVEFLSVPIPELKASLEASASKVGVGQIAVGPGMGVSMEVLEGAITECEMEPSNYQLLSAKQMKKYFGGGV